MHFKLLFLTILGIFLGLPSYLYAQNGTIRGSIFDKATGDPLIGVTVQVKGTSLGSATDFDGKFSISLTSGTYNIQISYVSYQPVEIKELVVKAGDVTLVDNLGLTEDTQTLSEVVVTAQMLRNTESSLIAMKKGSALLVDGISSAKFRQTGDSEASEAIKRVTGVVVEGGKYVYVRGLGDRYTKTTLNSVDIPGLDPDRNSIQIDIFPTNLIDNIVVSKSAAAEMPADFTGGVVNIETKDFPEEKLFNVSASIGYNPAMHFNQDYFSYEGGKTDWLGIDDGTRDLPAQAQRDPFPAPTSAGVTPQEVNTFVKGFNKDFGVQNQTSLMDYGIGFSLGNQKNFSNGNSLGYIFSTSYKSSTVFYDDAIYGEYQRSNPSSVEDYELVYATVQQGALAERNTLLGTLGGLAFKTHQSKFKFSVLHLQNGEKRAAKFFIDDNGSAVGKSGFTASSDNLEFSQRAVTNFLLNGEHYNKDRSFIIDWKISPTLSKIVEPDIRKAAFTYTSSDTVLSPGAAGYPSRIWRNLEEVNLVGKIDFTSKHTLFGKEGVLKFGGSHAYKERDFEILTYSMQFFGAQPDFNGDPDNLMNDEFIYPDGSVYYSSGNANPNPNSFNSTVNNSAVYISEQFQLAKLKTIIGLRVENFVQRYTGRDAQGGNALDNGIVLDALDFFPSANLIYALTDDQNLRFSYSRTIARPSFKELSFAQILDPVSNRTFNGGLFRYSDWDGNLRETNIDNLDLRWELFMQGGELFSLSAFYKRFQNPIELVRIPEAQTTNEFQPRNVGDGTLLGVEIEIRKSLDFLAPKLQNFFVSGNVTLVESSISMTNTEFNSRKGYEKAGEKIEDSRDMAGQAPYTINLGLSYENTDIGLEAGFFYNVNGSTLTVVGGGLFPDVYSEPFHSLNFNFNKDLGINKRASITFSASNILNDVKENFYVGFGAEDQYYTKFNPGTSFSVGLRYNLQK